MIWCQRVRVRVCVRVRGCASSATACAPGVHTCAHLRCLTKRSFVFLVPRVRALHCAEEHLPKPNVCRRADRAHGELGDTEPVYVLVARATQRAGSRFPRPPVATFFPCIFCNATQTLLGCLCFVAFSSDLIIHKIIMAIHRRMESKLCAVLTTRLHEAPASGVTCACTTRMRSGGTASCGRRRRRGRTRLCRFAGGTGRSYRRKGPTVW